MATRGWEGVTGPPPSRPRAIPAGAKPSKYRSQKATVDGIVFDSGKESRRYQELKLMERAGLIQHLILQPVFDLYGANGERVGKYVGDFSYWLVEAGKAIVEDVKSPATRTRLYRLKAKLLRAQGIVITEV